MKKNLKYFLIILFLIFCSIYFYRWKQNEFLGLSEPKVESQKSIIKYAKENGISGEIFVSKNNATHPVLKKYFDFGFIYVLDKNFKLIDCNIESLGGRCFQDIQNDICNNIEIKPRKFSDKISGERIMKTLLDNSKCISTKMPLDFKRYDKIYLYTWVKYSSSCVNENSLKFIKHLDKSKSNFLLININSDFVE